MPKINDMLLKLDGLQYATSLDLNMGYYHIQVSKTSRLFFCGENTGRSVNQWELRTHRTFYSIE